MTTSICLIDIRLLFSSLRFSRKWFVRMCPLYLNCQVCWHNVHDILLMVFLMPLVMCLLLYYCEEVCLSDISCWGSVNFIGPYKQSVSAFFDPFIKCCYFINLYSCLYYFLSSTLLDLFYYTFPSLFRCILRVLIFILYVFP